MDMTITITPYELQQLVAEAIVRAVRGAPHDATPELLALYARQAVPALFGRGWPMIRALLVEHLRQDLGLRGDIEPVLAVLVFDEISRGRS